MPRPITLFAHHILDAGTTSRNYSYCNCKWRPREFAISHHSKFEKQRIPHNIYFSILTNLKARQLQVNFLGDQPNSMKGKAMWIIIWETRATFSSWFVFQVIRAEGQ